MRRLALELRNRLPSPRRIGPHAFYARALRPGDLVFDIGAHFGQHTEAMLAAGAGVVALRAAGGVGTTLRTTFPAAVVLQQGAAAEPGRA